MQWQRRWQMTQIVSDRRRLQNSFRWVGAALFLQQQACDVLRQFRRGGDWWRHGGCCDVACLLIILLLLVTRRIIILKVCRRCRRIVSNVFVLRRHIFGAELYRCGWRGRWCCLISCVAIFLERVFIKILHVWMIMVECEPELTLQLTTKSPPSKIDGELLENSQKRRNSFCRRKSNLKGQNL